MKHIFLALGLMAAISCKDKKKSGLVTCEPPSKDTIRTTVTFALRTQEFEAKVFYKPRMVDTTEPANADSSLLRPIKMKVYDKQIFIHVIDTILNPDKTKRAIDTFVRVEEKFVVEDLKKSW